MHRRRAGDFLRRCAEIELSIVDEFAVAGGLVKAPIRIVRAKTVPLMVPADAEIIIEGWVNTEWLEPEAPFGESHGHVNPKEYNPYMEVSAITRRKKAILCSIISQVTPSESSVIKKMAYEPLYLDHLRNALGVKCVTRVMLHAADGNAEADRDSDAQTEPSGGLARHDGSGGFSAVDVEDRHRRRRRHRSGKYGCGFLGAGYRSNRTGMCKLFAARNRPCAASRRPRFRG